MRMYRKVLFFICVLFQVSGCAVWYSMQSDLESRIDQWVEATDFTTALATLDQISPSHPQYAQLQRKKKHILQLVKEYETTTLQNAESETKQQHWQAAAQIYQQGMGKLPRSEPIAAAHQKFLHERQQQLELTTHRMNLYKAEWLLKSIPLQQQYEQLVPGEHRTDAITGLSENDIGDLYQELVQCGQSSMQRSDFELAEKCFTTAMEINPDGKRFPVTLDIPQQLAVLVKRRETTLSAKGEELLGNSRQALQKDDLRQAFKLFKKIPSRDQQNSAVLEFRKELNIRIGNNVKQGIEMGRKLYSQGDIERALAIWNSVRELDPNNEQLDNHIERAQHVLNKLKFLKKNEPVIAPPSTKKDKS